MKKKPFTKKQIKKTFQDHDIDDSGMLGGDYLLKALSSLELPVQESDLPDLLESVGREKEGAVHLDDFIDIVMELQEVDQEIEEEEEFVIEQDDENEREKDILLVSEAFDLLADPASKGITMEALLKACASQDWTEQQILEMMNEADLNHDGVIDPKEFKVICKRAGII